MHNVWLAKQSIIDRNIVLYILITVLFESLVSPLCQNYGVSTATNLPFIYILHFIMLGLTLANSNRASRSVLEDYCVEIYIIIYISVCIYQLYPLKRIREKAISVPLKLSISLWFLLAIMCIAKPASSFVFLPRVPRASFITPFAVLVKSIFIIYDSLRRCVGYLWTLICLWFLVLA